MLSDIFSEAWAALEVVGERPPPCGGFSFNMIDSHRALLFGGRQELGRVSDVYIFDLTTRVSVESYITVSQGKWPVRTGIGQAQPAIDGHHACTICIPLQSICVPFQSILGPLRQWKSCC